MSQTIAANSSTFKTSAGQQFKSSVWGKAHRRQLSMWSLTCSSRNVQLDVALMQLRNSVLAAPRSAQSTAKMKRSSTVWVSLEALSTMQARSTQISMNKIVLHSSLIASRGSPRAPNTSPWTGVRSQPFSGKRSEQMIK